MGAKYSTVREFGGQAARVGETVILCCPRHDNKPGTCLRAGMIVAVSGTKDLPWILDVKHPEIGPTTGRVFVETMFERDVEAMALNEWTWPLRR